MTVKNERIFFLLKSFLKYNHLNLPLTEDNHNKVVSIPLYPSLNDLQLKRIVDVLNCY